MEPKKKLFTVVLASAIAIGAVSTSASAATGDLSPASVEYEGKNQETVEPQAVPAVVGTAFISGAATAAGAAVGDWVADKIIGIWSSEQDPVNSDANLDPMFD
ncbi:hypothetical protein [Terribacillus saccharophilus]|uniref:hypothetical protein n=1 Tax=Terribacillus saccharophilus TaxID=361277 RepID=UPI0039824D8E